MLVADRMAPLGRASWSRMSSASTPPIRKNVKAATMYMMPIFLWSTVKIHDFAPVEAVGRR